LIVRFRRRNSTKSMVLSQ